MRASDKIVKASLTTIGKAMAGLDDQATWFQPGAEVAPGVTVTATPGHTSFAVASGSACMRAPPGVAIIPEPLRRDADWQVTDDRHADPAAAARHAFHAKAATERTLIAGAHFACPNLGHVEEASTGHRLAAVAWSCVLSVAISGRAPCRVCPAQAGP